MKATTGTRSSAIFVGVDIAKSVFQIAVADRNWKVVETHRLTRSQFERWFVNRAVAQVVMEACGSTHHFARWLNEPWASRLYDCRLNPYRQTYRSTSCLGWGVPYIKLGKILIPGSCSWP